MLGFRRQIALGAVLLLGACTQSKMVHTSGLIRDAMLRRDYPGALQTLRSAKGDGFREQDRVAYWMNEGMLLQLDGKFKESVAVLEKAEQRAKELYTKSISKQFKAVFSSDAAKDYEGEDYENVLVNVVKAIDFLHMGNMEGALVEARKINEKLALYNTRYEQRKNTYNQDAFAHWMMGLLFEMEGSFDDARIAYVKAMEVYKGEFAQHYKMEAPPYLAEDMVRAAVLSDAGDEAKKMREEYGEGLGSTAGAIKEMGEVILLHQNGEGPNKSDFTITCIVRGPADFNCDAEPGDEYAKRVEIRIPANATVVKMAIPQLNTHDPANHHVELMVGGQTAPTALAEPINAIARKALGDKMQRVWRDTIIRAITKVLASKAAGAAGAAADKGASGGKSKGPGLFSWAAEKSTSALMQATEEADKRAWTTLPARIEVARLMVPPGVHPAAINIPGKGKVALPKVKVEKGKRTFITFRTMP